MKVKIDIETQTFVRFGLVVLGFLAAIAAVFVARDALVLIGISLFLALALNPPVNWLANKMPGKSRIGATAVAYLLVVGLLGAIMLFVVPPIVQQTAKFTETVPSLIDKVTDQKYILDDFVNKYGLQDSLNNSIENVKNKATEASAQLGELLVNAVTFMVGGIINLVLVLAISFFMLVEGPMWIRKIWDLYDDQEKLESHRNTLVKMYRVVTGFVNGQLLVAGTSALFSFLALLIISLIGSLNVSASLALPLAMIIFVMALIPMIGTTIGCILVSLVLLIDSPLAAIIFVIYFIIYQQIENNFISPKIQSKTVELSVLWILIAVLIGASLFGLIGGLVSIPIAGSIRVLLVEYLERNRKKRIADSKKGPLSKLVDKISKDKD